MLMRIVSFVRTFAVARRFLLLISILLFSFHSLHAEEDGSSPVGEPQPDSFVLRESAFFVTAGPMLMVNTDDGTDSAPSPVMFSLGFGYDFFQDRNVFGEVRGSFFTNYYLWDGESAQPAEIENRTAVALSLMLDMTCGHVWVRGLNQFSLSGGLGVLVRVGLLASGVDSDDQGGEYDGTSYSTAGDDVSSINSWFYSKANFLYPEISFSYLRSIPSFLGTCMIGGEFRTYFSVGSAISGDFFDGMIFDLAVKVQF